MPLVPGLDAMHVQREHMPLKILPPVLLVPPVRGPLLLPEFAPLALFLSPPAELLQVLWELLLIAASVLLDTSDLTPVLLSESPAAMYALLVNSRRLIPKHALPALLVHIPLPLLVPAHPALLVNTPPLLVPLSALIARRVTLLLLLATASATLVPRDMSVPPLTDSPDARNRAPPLVVRTLDPPTWVPPS